MTSFITTPIFYANGEPHLGHAYSGIVADIFHRFTQLSGQDSFFITGTDEHGQKIAQTAEKAGENIHQFIDQKSASFSALWPEINIEPDIFVRTTQSTHKHYIQTIWQQLQANDDIYLGTYRGDYCLGCEQFYSKHELVDETHCPTHKQAVQSVEEETYLFRLDKYRRALLAFYQSNPNAITPNHFQQAIIRQLEEGPLDDLSISRINTDWGVAVPGDPSHTIYVWIDALFSYITAIQQAGHSPVDIARTRHILGKDIFKFHALYWPAFLLALDLPLPNQLIVHGWWTIEGHKISKSIPQTTSHPCQFSNALSTDGLRYALVRQKPLYRDGNLALDELSELINADLVNNFANLVKRNHTLILTNFDGVLSREVQPCLDDACLAIVSDCERQLRHVIDSYSQHDLYQATLTLQNTLTTLNRFFHERAPWAIKQGQTKAHVQSTCFVVSNILREISFLYAPITPQLAQRVLTELQESESSLLNDHQLSLRPIHVTSANSHFQRV
ncbi:methionine--tRNA ligase [Vibrio ostreicida]|uniref:Methionine--tRNA ligase n=1 Tax=Vibrio ostreicida TaxID=526588 RepID=A0ABT8BV17_9VIBR|nr:methionine--tRNA ligase [Vibrio ostreicida]MDN3610236.1 methionine--tRNA ligase [Vibrio ostreicida]NPD07746.1 methionine--tRNA ligase [Vibrio ostreicida]